MAVVEKKGVIPSGPPGYPILGDLPDFLRDKLGFLSRCADQYGDVVKLKIGEPTYLLLSPEDIEHVLVKNYRNYEKSPRLTSRKGRQLSGEGLLTTYAAEHLRQKRMMQPHFYHKSIRAFANIIIGTTEQMLAEWRDGAKLNIAEEMMNLAQRVILKSLFSGETEEDIDKLAKIITIRRKYFGYVFLSPFPFPEYLPTYANREYRGTIKQIDEFIYSSISARRATVTPPQDLLTMLMSAQYEDGSTITDKQAHDEALTISITGYETIGEALAWTWYLLSEHPLVESKLFMELNEVLGGRMPAIDDAPMLRYTEMILYESMRLYPPTWIFVRMAQEADVLPSGATIPLGSKIYLCQYIVHRSPRFFSKPEKFDPERFSEAARRERPKFAYFPFGGGPRLCIGEPFAMMECVLILACIARRFQLTLLPGQKIVPEPGITLRPKNGIIMRLKQR
jgi:cytochrome P450